MKKKILSYVKKYGTLTVGLFLYAFAYNLFLKPNNIVAGDVDGIANIFKSIIDPNLLNETGGIVQGMSGSPIIQGNYIIGAVTHVVVDNPKEGYGIFITNMLEESEN